MKTLYWLVKRELWEHRGGFFWAPIITGGVFLMLNLMAIISGEVFGSRHGYHFDFGGGSNDITNFAAMIHSLDAHQMQMVGAGLDVFMLSASFLMCVVFAFVAFFYYLGSLYDDRRDRSILFWKSLPISDSATVVSKVIAAAIVGPIIVLICGVLTGILMLMLVAFALSLHGVSLWSLLTLAHPFHVIGFLIGSIPLYVLWALPTAGWLMLCSAAAKTKPFLWALVIPVAIGVIVGWFHLLNFPTVNVTWYWHQILPRALLSVFPGGWLHGSLQHDPGNDPQSVIDFLSLSNTYGALAAPDIWIGAVLGVAMLAGAIWFRRWRDDS
jgi:ABC-2 type transport system permease protein